MIEININLETRKCHDFELPRMKRQGWVEVEVAKKRVKASKVVADPASKESAGEQ